MAAYKDKERNTWFCKFTYIDRMGNRKQKKKRGFKRKRDALQWEREFLTSSGLECPETFRDLVNYYMDDISVRCRESTIETKKYVIDTKLIPFFGNRKVEEITPAMVRTWQSAMIRLNYKPTYLRFMHTQLSSILNYAVIYYGLKDNPCVKAGAIGKAKPREMDFWTEDEYRTFISAVPDGSKYKYIFEILYWSGIREGELQALTKEDIDLDRKTISITKTYVKIRNGIELINPPKTEGSRRKVFIPDFLCAELRPFLDSRQPGERLFQAPRTSIRNALIRYSEKAGTKAIRVHDLRHSHASLLINMGLSPKVIAQRLGHENIQTTLNIYSHLYPSAQEEVADMLQNLYEASK